MSATMALLLLRRAAGLAASLLIVGATLRLALSQRKPPARCPAGLSALGARCCGDGQRLDAAGHCRGRAQRCAADMQLDASGRCLAPARRVRIGPDRLAFGATDWEGLRANPSRAQVASFALDAFEVTVARFRACAEAGVCAMLSAADAVEPGLPVRNVSAAQASRFCRFAGGRLPTSAEWMYAAAGSAARRYPWGVTGLVCRRAAFGLVRGPCAGRALGPDLAGARPDGATPEGVFDLAGNVAEWTLDADGTLQARGGSYRSELAAELKSWAGVTRGSRAPDVGFRCAYDLNASALGGAP